MTYDEAYEVFKVVFNALEKQIPKKPHKEDAGILVKKLDGKKEHVYEYSCPRCLNPLRYWEGCSANGCGQCIDWSESND